MRFAVAILVLLVPELAFASHCWTDTEWVPVLDCPLDYLNVGVVIAALLLLRWRGQPDEAEVWEPDWVLGPDPNVLEEERASPTQISRTREPSKSEQRYLLTLCLLGSVVAGVVFADVRLAPWSWMSWPAVFNAGLVLIAINLRANPRPLSGSRSLRLWLRRGLLVLVIMLSGRLAHHMWFGVTPLSETHCDPDHRFDDINF